VKRKGASWGTLDEANSNASFGDDLYIEDRHCPNNAGRNLWDEFVCPYFIRLSCSMIGCESPTGCCYACYAESNLHLI
jgi:hypothetical protein